MDHDKEDMFHRIITPSEKHGHLRIPKRNVEFFEPRRAESGQNYVFIPFTDDSGNAWEFRYCRWKKRGSWEYAYSDGTWLPFLKAMRLKVISLILFDLSLYLYSDNILFLYLEIMYALFW